MSPEPEKVREIAREYLTDRINEPSDVGAYVMGFVGYDLTKHEFGAWCSAVRTDLRAAVPSWPDEQPQDEGDGEEAARVRVRVWLHEWSHKVQSNLVATGCGRHESDGCTELTAPDIDALLAAADEPARVVVLTPTDAEQADRDAELKAVASVFRWLDIERDKGTLRIGAGTSAALALLQEKFAGPIAELHVRENGGTA